MRKHELKDDAFTGLEAAIVLIAFVVVAAVFSYVVLGAGFFTTQKSQETVYSATKQASANLAEIGPVVVQSDEPGTYVQNLSFNIKLAAGANPVDLSRVTYHVTTSSQDELFVDEFSETTGYDKVNRTSVLLGDSDNLLEKNEIDEVKIELRDRSGYTDFNIGVNDMFSVEIKPDVGAPLLLQKHAPAGMANFSVYEVY